MTAEETIKTAIPSQEELDIINMYTRHNYLADELYIFSVVLCDNEVDRDLERFSDEALKTLSTLYIGKTGICNHDSKAQNQQARIYACKFETVEDKKNSLGMTYCRVNAKAYVPISDKTIDLINHIESGIKKEISIGCSVRKKFCSVCGCDLSNNLCEHKKGVYYNGKLCHVILDKPSEVYEWAFVATTHSSEKTKKRRNIIAGDKLVGYAQVNYPEMVLNNFMIFDDYQGRGYGKAAVKLLIEQYGIKKLWVKQGNDKAKHVYESCGFEPSKITTHFQTELKG